jgi:hypothetical protein
MNTEKYWDFVTLGELENSEKAAFYNEIIEDIEGDNLFGMGDSRYFENPTFRVGMLNDDLSVSPAMQTNRDIAQCDNINLYLEKYYVYDMPGDNFNLQIMIETRHRFNENEETDIGHTIAVQGLKKDFVNYLSEPVFKNLSIGDELSLGIMVNFIGDKKTDSWLSFIKSDVVTTGLDLVGSFNPIYGTAANYIKSIAGGILAARKNQAITNMKLTFLKSPGITSLPFVEGTYILIQPMREEKEIDFNGIVYDKPSGYYKQNGHILQRNHMELRIKAVN